MTQLQLPTRLQKHLAAMFALEQLMEKCLEQEVNRLREYPEVAADLNSLREIAVKHQQTLAIRMRAVAPDVPVPNPGSYESTLEDFYDTHTFPASAALIRLHTLLDQGILQYTILMELCLRAADSWVRDPQNSAEIALQHLGDYTAAAQKIVQRLHTTIAGELEQQGQECQCTCPSCSLGICLCATASHRFLGEAWTEAGPIYTPGVILMAKPRKGSAAEKAGLQKGDLVLKIDGKEIESLPMLQEAVRNHASGEEIQFQVQQRSGEQAEMNMILP